MTCNVKLYCSDALHGGCNSWYQLQRFSNVAAISHFKPNFWLHTVQLATLQPGCMDFSMIGCNCNVATTLLQHHIVDSIFGCRRCSLQRCCNVVWRLLLQVAYETLLQPQIFNLVFWFHAEQLATTRLGRMEVLKVGCNCSVVATLLQLYIVNMIFGCIRCSLQRCSNFAWRLQQLVAVATLLQPNIFNSIFGCMRCNFQRCIEVTGMGYDATLLQCCLQVGNCWNVLATLIQLLIFNPIFGCKRCSLQHCSLFAWRFQ